MKILMTVFECMDIGGIGTDVDWKIRGIVIQNIAGWKDRNYVDSF